MRPSFWQKLLLCLSASISLCSAGCIHDAVEGTCTRNRVGQEPYFLISLEFGTTDRQTLMKALGQPVAAYTSGSNQETLIYVPTKALYKVSRTWPLPFSGTLKGHSAVYEFTLRDGILVNADASWGESWDQRIWSWERVPDLVDERCRTLAAEWVKSQDP